MLRLIKLIGRPIFRILFSVEYAGLENVPATGAVILAGNHPSYLDPVLVTLPVNRIIRFMAWDALFKIPLLGQIIRALGAFPVDITRGKGESAYREALRVLEGGEALGIFPEGKRSDRGPMGELRAGTARLALDTGAPIVPVTIGGAFRAWPKHRLLPKPAKIVVRFHQPVYPDQFRAAGEIDDRKPQQEIMRSVAEKINRSLAPALHSSESFERWYKQPPSHIRSYEWAPLIAAIVATVVAALSGRIGESWIKIWAPAAVYYLYLIADLSLIKPGRTAKWLRNSMPVWLILAWHYPLTEAIGVSAGELNLLLVAAALLAFFPYFYEDYYTLQKFVRGLVVVYYFSLAVALRWPHPLGVLVATLGFIAIFSIRYKTLYYQAVVGLMLAAITLALILKGPVTLSLLAYGLLSVAALLYIQTFVAAAYDIRKAGNVAHHKDAHAA
ncbi:MAG TPA: lysophospholipid acyltransferase family protein [Blastocatellia bacterium]|nr:lysophospholipid acyltransferase family protein [Blastocatellia bacterium]